jgi:hypothetical protein
MKLAIILWADSYSTLQKHVRCFAEAKKYSTNKESDLRNDKGLMQRVRMEHLKCRISHASTLFNFIAYAAPERCFGVRVLWEKRSGFCSKAS